MLKSSLHLLGFVVFSLHLAQRDAFPVSPPPLVRAGAESNGVKQGGGTTRDTYVTLLYGGFLLGARVLGQSLRETGTKKDMIALCTEEVSGHTKQVLQADGWMIRSITNIHNPREGRSRRGDYFAGIFSKLHIWNMTEYDRVIYLDADALVLSNIDHMFDCGTFCAAYRHSDLFNAGILVVKPSKAVFQDMLAKIPSTPSYDDGDQGFLNVYFKSLRYASMFDWSDSKRQQQPMRMPAGLNADVGPYYTNSRWIMPEENIRIIHYTLGPIKPWIWWYNSVSDLNVMWTNVRKRLPRYGHHTDTCQPPFLALFWLPYPILVMVYIGVESCCHRWISNKHIAKLFGDLNVRLSHFIPLAFVFLSYVLAYEVVPTTMMPNQAEYVFWLWSNCFVLMFMGFYCHLCHITGRLRDSHHFSYPRKKSQTLILYIVFAVSYVIAKVLPPYVEPFSKRVMSFFTLAIIHLAVSHVTGQYLIQLWSGYTGKLWYYTRV